MDLPDALSLLHAKTLKRARTLFLFPDNMHHTCKDCDGLYFPDLAHAMLQCPHSGTESHRQVLKVALDKFDAWGSMWDGGLRLATQILLGLSPHPDEGAQLYVLEKAADFLLALQLPYC